MLHSMSVADGDLGERRRDLIPTSGLKRWSADSAA